MANHPLSNGLSADEATARLAHFGPNHLNQVQQRSVLLQYLAHFRNPLVVVLLVASAISWQACKQTYLWKAEGRAKSLFCFLC